MAPPSPMVRAVAATPQAQPSLRQMPVSYSAAGSGQALRILCYGDSMTVGFCKGGREFAPYARTLAERVSSLGSRACEVLTCGLSGMRADTMADGLTSDGLVDVMGFRGKGLARILDESGPFDVVLIMAGTNDLGCHQAPSRVVASLDRLHRACRDRGVPSVALAPPPAPCRDAAGEARRLQVAEALRAMASPRMACVDPAELVSRASPDVWDTDGLHFAPSGSHAFGHKLAELVVQHVLPSPRPKLVGPPAKPCACATPVLGRRFCRPAVLRAPARVLVRM